MPTLLGKLVDQLRVALRIKTGPKQVAKVSGGGTITQLQAGGDINVENVLVVDRPVSSGTPSKPATGTSSPEIWLLM